LRRKFWPWFEEGCQKAVTRYLKKRYYRQLLKMKLYLYEKCETCRKATRWLDEKKIEYKAIPIREQPPTKKELTSMLKSHGGNFKKLFNTSGKDYRDPELKARLPSLTEKEVIDLLNKQGNLIKRPFLFGESKLLQGFKPDLWEEEFSE